MTLFKIIFCLVFTIQICAEEWSPNFYRPLEDKQTTQMKYALKEIQKLNLTGNESILDVGCGDGAITAYLAQNFVSQGTVHGIDISQSMIEKATQHSNPNLSFEQVSLFDYETHSSYDVVVCFWTLYLFDNYQEAFNRLVSYAKPGGKILICHILDPATPFFQLFKKFIAPQKMPIIMPSLESVVATIRSTPVNLEYLKVQYNYGPFESVQQLYYHMNKIPFFQLPKEKEVDFLEELTKIYPPKEDGSIEDYAHAVTVIVEKRKC